MSIKTELSVGFVSLARQGFDMDYAKMAAEKSFQQIKKFAKVVAPEGYLVGDNKGTQMALELFKREKTDLLVIQCGTFTSAEIVLDWVSQLGIPVVIWAIKEPDFEGKLKLNSLVCANAITSALYKMDAKFKFFYEDYKNEQFYKRLARYLNVVNVKNKLKKTRIGLVGARSTGFQDVTVDELSLLKKIGPRVHFISIAEVFERAKKIKSQITKGIAEEMRGKGKLKNIGQGELVKSAEVYQALKELASENNLDALAVRCLPEFAQLYGTVICGCLSFLTDDGIIAACEADVPGAISMLIQKYLSDGNSPFLADLIEVDNDKNTGLFWHCGVAPCSLARNGEVELSRHYVRDLGVTVHFSLKPGRINLARLDSVGTDYRMLIASGESTGETIPMKGTSMNVVFDQDSSDLLDIIINKGFPHHFSIVYGDLKEDLIDLCNLLEIESVEASK